MHKNLNVEDGLVYSQALSIYQDSKGYLWIGTSNGVSRWDGIKFKNLFAPKTNNISPRSMRKTIVNFEFIIKSFSY